MEPKFKDTRQFAGQTFKTMPATPDGEESDEFVENKELHVSDEIEHYSLKKSSLDIAIEFARLTDGPSLDDILGIAAMFAGYIASKS